MFCFRLKEVLLKNHYSEITDDIYRNHNFIFKNDLYIVVKRRRIGLYEA